MVEGDEGRQQSLREASPQMMAAQSAKEPVRKIKLLFRKKAKASNGTIKVFVNVRIRGEGKTKQIHLGYMRDSPYLYPGDRAKILRRLWSKMDIFGERVGVDWAAAERKLFTMFARENRWSRDLDAKEPTE
jgi:hypothetical protein